MLKHILISALIFCALIQNLSGQDNCPSEVKGVHPPTKPVYKLLLITGCARSGTTFIADVLWHCGLQVYHEAPGRDGIVSWLMAARDVKTPYGPAYYNYRFKHIFHQV